jgi:lycopene cyclase domain-containing protein
MGYLSILIGVFALSAALKQVYRVTLFDSRKQGVAIFGFFFLVGVVWDSYAVHSGHWYFNDHNLVGVRVGLLPIEEYLFFIVLPFFIITFYQVLRARLRVGVAARSSVPHPTAAGTAVDEVRGPSIATASAGPPARADTAA